MTFDMLGCQFLSLAQSVYVLVFLVFVTQKSDETLFEIPVHFSP